MSIPCLPCLEFVCNCQILYGREGKIAYECEGNECEGKRMCGCRARINDVNALLSSTEGSGTCQQTLLRKYNTSQEIESRLFVYMSLACDLHVTYMYMHTRI